MTARPATVLQPGRPFAFLAAAFVGISTGVAVFDADRLGWSAYAFHAALLLPLCAALVVLALAPGDNATPLTNDHGSRIATLLYVAWLLWAVAGSLSAEPISPLLSATVALEFVVVSWLAVQIWQRATWSGISVVVWFALAANLAASPLAREFDSLGGRLGLATLEPNQLGRLCGVGVVVGFTLIVYPRGRFWHPKTTPSQLFGLAMASASGVGLLLTQSRTSVAATTVAVTFLILPRLPARLRVVSVALSLLAIAAVLVLAQSGELVDLASRNSNSPNELQSGNGRTQLWPAVLEAIEERPIQGHGLGSGDEILNDIVQRGGVPWGARHTHSLPLHLALTTGWVGALLFTAAGLTAMVSAIRNRRYAAIAGLTFLFVAGTTEATLRLAQPAIVLFVACILDCTPPLTERPTTNQTRAESEPKPELVS